jgi:hypothetical protein
MRRAQRSLTELVIWPSILTFEKLVNGVPPLPPRTQAAKFESRERQIRLGKIVAYNLRS